MYAIHFCQADPSRLHVAVVQLAFRLIDKRPAEVLAVLVTGLRLQLASTAALLLIADLSARDLEVFCQSPKSYLLSSNSRTLRGHISDVFVNMFTSHGINMQVRRCVDGGAVVLASAINRGPEYCSEDTSPTRCLLRCVVSVERHPSKLLMQVWVSHAGGCIKLTPCTFALCRVLESTSSHLRCVWTRRRCHTCFVLQPISSQSSTLPSRPRHLSRRSPSRLGSPLDARQDKKLLL